jgi:hypothetical protein
VTRLIGGIGISLVLDRRLGAMPNWWTGRWEAGCHATGYRSRTGWAGRGSHDITPPPPLECLASTNRPERTNVDGGVPEREGVEGGSSDGAGFGRVYPVKLRNGFRDEHVRVFYPLIM